MVYFNHKVGVLFMSNCNKRDGRFEILRVFSMVLIIFHHYGCFKLISNFGGKYSIMDIFLFDYIWDMFWNFLISRKKIKLESND